MRRFSIADCRFWIAPTALFIVALGLGGLGTRLASGAQAPLTIPRIGYLGSSPSADRSIFRQGLRELGWIEGQNVAIEYRWTEGRPERFPDLVAELIRLRVTVLYIPGSVAAARAAKSATTTIPIVFATPGEPVAAGLVPNLSRHGGNITGIGGSGLDLSAKRLQLLKEAVPTVTRVAVLWTPANPTHRPTLKEVQVAARTLGIQLQTVEVRDRAEFDGAFSAMRKERAGALSVFGDVMFFQELTRIVALAAEHRLPAMYIWREAAEGGGLMSYGSDRAERARRAAVFVHKILRGAKPADLPVEQSTKYELVINLKTARSLGLKIPQSLMIRADEVIQ